MYYSEIITLYCTGDEHLASDQPLTVIRQYGQSRVTIKTGTVFPFNF